MDWDFIALRKWKEIHTLNLKIIHLGSFIKEDREKFPKRTGSRSI